MAIVINEPVTKERVAALRKQANAENPKSEAQRIALQRAQSVYQSARATFESEQRSRRDGKAERIAAADALRGLASKAVEEAKSALTNADREYNRQQFEAETRLHADIAVFAALSFDPFAKIKFTQTIPTGKKEKSSYGRDEYEIHRFENTEQFEFPQSLAESATGARTFAIEFNDVRIKFRGDARDLDFEVELLSDEKFLNGGTVRNDRFGYSASASLESRWSGGAKAKIRWGSFSGMETVKDAEDTQRVHQVAIEIGRILEALA